MSTSTNREKPLLSKRTLRVPKSYLPLVPRVAVLWFRLKVQAFRLSAQTGLTYPLEKRSLNLQTVEVLFNSRRLPIPVGLVADAARFHRAKPVPIRFRVGQNARGVHTPRFFPEVFSNVR